MEAARKHSRKRDAILSYLRTATCHPTAEMIYQALKAEFPDLSLGTVYRNLTLFKDEGVIKSCGSLDGQERFDGRLTPHSHLTCSRCGALIDIEQIDLPLQALEALQAQTGCRIDSYALNFYGLCPNCLKDSGK